MRRLSLRSLRPVLIGGLDLAGYLAIVYGFSRIYRPLGWILGGALLVLVALALEGRVRFPSKEPDE